MDITFFQSPSELRKWLEEHYDSTQELWVGFYKKGSGKPSITWPEAVDEALCFGWIDGVRKSIDEVSYTIRFTPRKPNSIWSAVNIKRVGELHLIPLCLNFFCFPVHRSQPPRVCSQFQRRV